jgi:hypothetical protein
VLKLDAGGRILFLTVLSNTFELEFRPFDHMREPRDVDAIEHGQELLPYNIKSVPRTHHLCNLNQTPIADILRRKVAYWGSTETCRRLLSTLSSAAVPQVNKIVAVACGSMLESDTADGERSVIQHAAMLTLRDHFAARQGV